MNRWIQELQRRNVLRVAAAYAIAAWLVLQVADVLSSLLQLPPWLGQAVVFILLLGFPVALVLSWVFEFTAEGLQRESDLDAERPVDPYARRRLDLAIMGLMAVGLAWFTWDKFLREDPAIPNDTHRSLAVIPFSNAGADDASAFFATGIHDDLLTQLAKISDLKVISRTSVLEYAGTTKNLKVIGEELGVGHILEGGVQKAGDRIRINAQLIDAATDTHLWAETFDREMTTVNIFEVQSEIAHLIARSLHATLAPQTVDAIAKPPTENLEAWRDYLAAREVSGDLEIRLALLESALDKDPQFALAWVALADAYMVAHRWGREQYPEAMASSLDALARAEAIDPDLPQIHLARALQLYHGERDTDAALRELERAEQGLPGHPDVYVWRGNIYRSLQRMDEALVAYRRALELDPRNETAHWEVGLTLRNMRRYDDARTVFDQAFVRFPDNPRWLHASAQVTFFQTGDARELLRVVQRPDWPQRGDYAVQVALFAWMAGDLETAAAFAPRITQGAPDLPAEVLKAEILADAGEAARARELLEGFVQRTEAAGDEALTNPSAVLGLAMAHAALGNEDEARRLVERVEAQVNRGQVGAYGPLEDKLGMARTLCAAGALDQAEIGFRELLQGVNPFSLSSLVNYWPPCRDRFEGTEQYLRLEAEFRHRP